MMETSTRLRLGSFAPRLGTLLCILWSVFSPSASAQRYQIRNYSEDDGLPDLNVRGIGQSSDGAIWLTTRTSLVRYDGFEWKTHHPVDRTKRDRELQLLALGEDDNAWVAVLGPSTGIARFDGEHWSFLPPFPQRIEGAVASLKVVGKGDRSAVLVATVGGDLLLWDGRRWRQPLLRDGETWLSSETCNREFFLGTNRGLLRLDPSKPEEGLLPHPLAPSRPIELLTYDDNDARLWLGGEDWIGTIHEGSFQELGTAMDFGLLPCPGPRLAEPGPHGGLYFGDWTGMRYFHPDHGSVALGRSSGLAAHGTQSLCRDREGNLWIGTGRSLSKIVGKRFAGYDREHGLWDDEVTAILPRKSGSVLLGHEGGLTEFGDSPRPRQIAPDRRLARILDLYEDPTGTVWIAAHRKGLGELLADESIRWHLPPNPNDSINSVLTDLEGTMWVGTESGVYTFDDGEFQLCPLETATGLQPYVRRLFLSQHDGAILAATSWSGVFRIADGEKTHFISDAEKRLADWRNNVYTVDARKDGRLWLGTLKGLALGVDGEIRSPDPAMPRVGRPIYFILHSETEGVDWFGTDRGLFRWDGKVLRAYSTNHGLLGSETNRDAGWLDPQGRVWVGTDCGLSIYRPWYDLNNEVAPTITLDGIDVQGTVHPLDAPLEFRHDRDTLLFLFRAVSFRDESKIRFRTRLAGHDPEWIVHETLPTSSIRYANLKPGHYHFEVQAIDLEENRSEIATSPAITILQPFWRRPAFLILFGLGLLTLGGGVFSWISQHRSTRRLEGEVKERTSALRESEARIAAEKERLAVTLAGIAEAVVASDRGGRVVLWNPAAELLHPRDWSPAKETTLDDLYRAELPQILELAHRVLDEGIPRRIGPIHVTTLGETPVDLEISASPIPGPAGDETDGVVLVLQDVTARRRFEADLARTQKLEAVGILAGGIAHDFNNILTGILGGLSLLENREPLSPEGTEAVKGAISASHRARSLTQQLLTFSRGGAPIREVRSISQLVREAASFVLTGSNIRPSLDLAENLSPVEIDAGQMSQVLENLLINARQAMPRGGTVLIRGRNHVHGEKRTVRLEVIDQGTGIPATQIDRVFDPYFTTKADGSGLGLAVAHSIVSKHDGKLTVRSEPGRGTGFSIELPAARTEERYPSSNPHPLPNPDGGRLLVLEDEAIVREVVGKMLEHLGFDATFAQDGETAVETYRTAHREGIPFDAILVDLTLPGSIGGDEAVRRIAAFDPQVKAIVSSGYSNDPVLAHYAEYGFCARLEKPFGTAELRRTLARVTGREPEMKETS